MSAKKRPGKQGGRPNAEPRRQKDDQRATAVTNVDVAPAKKPIVKWVLLALVAALLVFAIAKKFIKTPPKPIEPKPVENEKQWNSLVDGPRIMDSVKRLVDMGPRVAGTAGSDRAQDMIKAELGAAGITDIREQKFTEQTPEGECSMTNIVGVLPGKQKEGIALAAHYDSKLFKEFHFIGANDAASAVGVLFELARKLKAGAADRDLTYYFLFFDGEEAFRFDWMEWKEETGKDDNTYGSRHFARKMEEEGYPIKALILLDLVGDKDYSLVDDERSNKELMAIFKKASLTAFGVNHFVQQSSVGDDHIPFVEKDIPAIDIIDLEYKGPDGVQYWHTPLDTLDKLSTRSLERTGTLVLTALPDVEAMVMKGLRIGAGTKPTGK